MTASRDFFYIFAALISVLILFSAAYVVDPHEQVLVVKFGEPKRVIKEPGLYWKWPGLENLVLYDKRLLALDLTPEEIIMADKNRIVVDTFTHYRIKDPLLFYQKARTVARANRLLADQISPDLRKTVAKVNFTDLLSENRADIMAEVLKEAASSAQKIGVEVVDIRIRRADVPQQNSQAIYDRMNSERERIAKQLRAKGKEQAQVIRAEADKESAVILANAQREAQKMQGEGDAKAAAIYAKAHAKNPKFYEYYRTLKAYENSLVDTDQKATLFLDPKSFKFFQKMNA